MTDLIKRETVFAAALLILMAGVFYLFYAVMAPFFVPLAWGAILVVSLEPLYIKLRSKCGRSGTAAFLMTLLVSVVIIGPLSYLVTALVGEASSLYALVQANLAEGSFEWIDLRTHPFVQGILERLNGVVDTSEWDLNTAAANALRDVSGFVVKHSAAFITNVGRGVFQFMLVILAMYYLFKDGDKLMAQVRASIPLPGDRAGRMLSHVTDVVRATIFGGLVVAAIQGILGGLMFWALGIPSPVFWGAVMGFLSLIPVLGAFIVYVPAAIILALSGAYIKAIILAGFGIGVVSQIDNFLKPLLLSGRTHLHPLLLFFSILGGLQVFGFLGLILGPVVASVFVGVFDLYRHSIYLPEPAPPAPEDPDPAPAN